MTGRGWVLALGVVALSLATGTGCHMKNKVRILEHSPDGTLQAFVYSREVDLGATVGEEVHVSVLPRGRLPGDEEPNVLSADAGHDPTVSLDVRVMWQGPARLAVEIDPRVRFFRRQTRVGEVQIVYLVPTGLAR